MARPNYLITKDFVSASADTTKTYGAPILGIRVYNDGASSITVDIGDLPTITVATGDAPIEILVDPVTTFSVTATTNAFRVFVLG